MAGWKLCKVQGSLRLALYLLLVSKAGLGRWRLLRGERTWKLFKGAVELEACTLLRLIYNTGFESI
jgi:hypothetical protein